MSPAIISQVFPTPGAMPNHRPGFPQNAGGQQQFFKQPQHQQQHRGQSQKGGWQNRGGASAAQPNINSMAYLAGTT